MWLHVVDYKNDILSLIFFTVKHEMCRSCSTIHRVNGRSHSPGTTKVHKYNGSLTLTNSTLLTGFMKAHL